MARISRESQIEFQERERSKLPKAKFKGRYLFVEDTDWGSVDPIQTITSTESIRKEELADEIIRSCGFFNATMMSFVVPFPDLC